MAFLFETSDDIEDAVASDTEAEQAVDAEALRNPKHLDDEDHDNGDRSLPNQ